MIVYVWASPKTVTELTRPILSENLVCTFESKAVSSPIVFSSDARRVAYIAGKDGKKCAVIDGVAGKGYNEIYIDFSMFSPECNRIAYVSFGFHWPPGYQYRVFLDGEEKYKYDFIRDLVFSPDGQHIAYVCIKGPKMSVTVDRTEGQEYEILGSTSTSPSATDMNIRLVVFDSADRFHYLVRKGDSIYIVEEKLDNVQR